MTSLGVALIGFGVILIASGVKDVDPVTVITDVFTGRPFPKKGSGKNPTPAPGTTGSGGGGGSSSGW